MYSHHLNYYNCTALSSSGNNDNNLYFTRVRQSNTGFDFPVALRFKDYTFHALGHRVENCSSKYSFFGVFGKI